MKSKYINAPVIEGSPLVIECKLIEADVLKASNFTMVFARIINVAAEETVLSKNGTIDARKTGLLFFDSFSNSYFSLGEKAGNAWNEGKKYV